MSTTLCIGLDALHAQDAQWALFNADGSLHGNVSRGALSDAAALSADHQALVIVNTFAITRTTTDLPVRGKKLAQALPFALEEQFASDVEALHFAAGDSGANGTRPVAAIEREALEHCIATLHAAGVQFASLYTIHDALSPLEHFTQLLVLGDNALLLTEHEQPVGFESIAIDDVIAAWSATSTLDDEDTAQQVAHTLRVFADGDAVTRQSGALDAIAAGPHSADVKRLDQGWLPFAARTVITKGGVNLMQGSLAVRTDPIAVFRPWLVAASLFAVVALVGLMSRYLDYRGLQQQSAALDAQMAEVIQQMQGGQTVDAADAERILQSALRKRGGGGAASGAPGGDRNVGFLPTLDTFAQALSTLPETEIDGIAFRNGVFDIQLLAPDAGTLESLTKQMSSDGVLQARIQRTEQRDEGVKSFVQIQAASR
ncbi:MAG: type II secretion system protein GspL [Pseudomonadota bacterium]